MLTFDDLDKDQHDAIDILYDNDHTFLIAGMGAGKSIVALTAVSELMQQGDLKRVLLVSPLKAAQSVWTKEHKKWTHTEWLSVIVAAGQKDRDWIIEDDRRLAMCDVLVINFELLPWMKENDLFKHFDGLIIDESTKLKGGGAQFKALRHAVKSFDWRVVMSGTPVSENWQQLFYQLFIVDGGVRLGKNKKLFLYKYFYPTDYKGYKHDPKPDTPGLLASLIKDVVYTIPDYRHTLPAITTSLVELELDIQASKAYYEMATRMSVEGVVANTAAEKVMKLQQLANGFIYDGGEVIDIHFEKQIALDSILKNPANEIVENFLIIYQFEEEKIRLQNMLGEKIIFLDSKNPEKIIENWNSGKIKYLAMHPKTGGHGLNMASGGNRIIWMSIPWSRDLLDQTNARIWRRGQTRPVQVDILIAAKTVDKLILARLDSKSAIMPELMAHLSALNSP